jgi:cytochrome P450
MAKLRKELRTIPEAATWSQLEQLPYLNACISEGDRLCFGITSRAPRIALDESLHYKQYSIPLGTALSGNTLAVHTNESIFPDPWAFKPKRWLCLEWIEKRKYNMAFNKGTGKCIGIHLSDVEMCLAIAAVTRYDMKLHETDISNVEFLSCGVRKVGLERCMGSC